MTPAELHHAVQDVLVRYASGIDRKDFDLLGSVFTPDVDADYGDIGHWHSREEVVGFLRQSHGAPGHTLHRITNVVVTATDAGASSRAYVDALVMIDARSGVRAVGYYDDELVQGDEGWQVARRRYTHVLLESVQDMAAPVGA